MDAIDKWASRFLRPGKKTGWAQLALALLIFGGAVLLTAQSYRAIDRELTEAALSRRSSVAYLAAATLLEKVDRLTDIGIALVSRVLLP